MKHTHDRASRRPLHDARGIYCGLVCNQCEAAVRASFRTEIFTDPAYVADEPIEEES